MGKLIIPYEGLLDIPEQKVGAFEVKHVIEPAGAKIKISNFRTCLYGGHPVKDVVYNYETRWHELLEDGGVWTSDRPIEQYQQRQSILGFRGRVLIGGLGLGVVVQMLTKYKGVTQIDVIEKAPEVMQLVQPYVGDKRVSFYRDDLFDFLKQSAKLERTYNHAFFDIWTSDGEGEFYETVVPLKLLARPIVRGKITCWNEDIMRGQVQKSLVSPLQLLALDATSNRPDMKVATLGNGEPLTLDWLATPSGDKWHDRLVPFYRSLRDFQPDLTVPFLTLDRINFLAARWARNYDGGDGWLSRWERTVKETWEFSEPYCIQWREQQAG